MGQRCADLLRVKSAKNKLLLAFLVAGLAWTVLRARRPDVVISTGAAVAWPFFLIARATGVPTVYIEVFDRLDTPTMTAQLCRPFSTKMLVQWEEQRALYRDTTVVGTLL